MALFIDRESFRQIWRLCHAGVTHKFAWSVWIYWKQMSLCSWSLQKWWFRVVTGRPRWNVVSKCLSLFRVGMGSPGPYYGLENMLAETLEVRIGFCWHLWFLLQLLACSAQYTATWIDLSSSKHPACLVPACSAWLEDKVMSCLRAGNRDGLGFIPIISHSQIGSYGLIFFSLFSFGRGGYWHYLEGKGEAQGYFGTACLWIVLECALTNCFLIGKITLDLC